MDVSPTGAGPERTATLWQQFAAPLRSFVAKRAPREVETEDVLQDVFVRIQEQLPNLRDADRIDAWIFQIARNVVADAFRARVRRDALADRTAAEDPVPDVGDDAPSAQSSLATCLTPMISRLSEPYRQAIELTELCGMSQVDAARFVGISISGMKSRVQRGREQLKAIIFDFCRVETDVRGTVIECDPLRAGCGETLRPSPCSTDSMGMSNTNPSITSETPPTTSSTTSSDAAASGCCGGPAPKDSAGGCCALDAEVKASGGTGCGCGTKKAAAPAKKGCC